MRRQTRRAICAGLTASKPWAESNSVGFAATASKASRRNIRAWLNAPNMAAALGIHCSATGIGSYCRVVCKPAVEQYCAECVLIRERQVEYRPLLGCAVPSPQTRCRRVQKSGVPQRIMSGAGCLKLKSSGARTKCPIVGPIARVGPNHVGRQDRAGNEKVFRV